MPDRDPDRVPRFARGPVLGAMAATFAVLTVGSVGYGYDRDELYFRMLRPAWGYVDQPALTPLIVHGTSRLVDTLWAIRLPGTVVVVLAILFVALCAREVGGDRAAQGLAAWGSGFGALVLALGHAALTATFDLPFWPAICWALLRAQLRGRPRWWLVAGALVGIDLWNKVLVVVLLVALLAGIVTGGPRSLVRSRRVWGGVAVALVVGSPTIAYQVTHGFPQLAMGRALAQHNGGDVRVQMWWTLPLLLGPPLTAVWLAGLVALLRRPAWRPVRFVGAAVPFLLLGVFAMGSQVYYPLGLVAVVYGVGAVPTVDWWRRGRGRRPLVVALVVVNAAVSVVIGLPVVPAGSVGSTPVAGVNMLVGDSIGWPAYVRQVSAVAATVPPGDRRAVVLASNYGEAGALARFGPAAGLSLPVVSGQNALWDQTRPADDVDTVVVVGGQVDAAGEWFRACRRVTTLAADVDVNNEEQGEPVAVCDGPRQPWTVLWPRIRHLD